MLPHKKIKFGAYPNKAPKPAAACSSVFFSSLGSSFFLTSEPPVCADDAATGTAACLIASSMLTPSRAATKALTLPSSTFMPAD